MSPICRNKLRSSAPSQSASANSSRSVPGAALARSAVRLSAVFDRVAEAAAGAGLEGLLDRLVESLSVGEFQRALFGRLLLQDAPVILLDEPFAAVDERTTEDLLRVVLQWHEAGRTVIAVLHDLDQVRAHFPTALLLARSCIGWGDTASVVTEENLARARDTVRGRTEGPVLA